MINDEWLADFRCYITQGEHKVKEEGNRWVLESQWGVGGWAQDNPWMG